MSVESGSTTVHPGRIRVMKSGSNPNGPVVYWMFRDQRVNDNWALIHAVNEANKRNSPIAVAFNLFDAFKGANARQLGFMLRGLKQLQSSLFDSLHIPFFLFQGEAVDTIPEFLAECKASLLVTDFTPLREIRKCKEEICKRVGDSVSIHEVDAHNVVPVWKTSSKLEYATRTITSKINELLPTYLTDFPTLVPPNMKWASSPPTIHWDQLIEDRLKKGAEVPEIYWCEPGETAALEVLKGSQNGFLTKRLKDYAISWNKPFNPNAQSGLSPYLHFGQISAQRCAVEACRIWKVAPERILSKFKLRGFGAFFEELIVRRELADNFCYYQPHYDSLMGAWEWARKTLMDHISDKREHLYTTEQLEKAQTADQLWNASQLEMVHYGKMHGFMRMYWGKKLLDWTSQPEEALATAIYLNDKYEIDGRDPNGYVGCMWSMCGVHDQAWREHPISGKVRFMDYACCKRRFDVKGYISYVENLVAETTKRKTEAEAEAEISLDQMEKEPCRLDLSLSLSLPQQ